MPFGPEVLYLKIPICRIGECDSCVGTYKQSWCCSDLSVVEFTTDVLADDMVEFMTAKGILCDKDKKAHFLVKQNCPQYDWDTRKCKIYATRPKICQRFPVHFAQLYETVDDKRVKMCSYDWDLNTSQEIVIDLFKMTEVLKIE